MGYDLEALLKSLDEVNVSYKTIPSDILRLAYGAVYTGSKRFLLNGRTFFPPAGKK